MKLIVCYYLKEEPQMILMEELDNIDIDDGFTRFMNIDNYRDNNLKTDLYSIMISILQTYYGNKYTNEIVDNQEEYERFFKEKFVYNYQVFK
jgi:hypothetical protein